jgi:hypothetical protein
MNPTAIYSKSGKGVQEAAGKTHHLSRGDRAVLSAIDGKTTVGELNLKFDKTPEDKFFALIEQLEKDGFIREVSPGVSAPASRPGAPKAPAKPAAPGKGAEAGEELDFTMFATPPPKPAAPRGPTVDLAAKARADAEQRAKEEEAVSYKARQEAEAKAKAEAEARARAEREARQRAEAEVAAKAKAEAEARSKAEAEAKIKAARDAALRLAADAKAKIEAERKAREEAERRAKEEAERIRKEAEEKSAREAEELKKRLEEAERKGKEEAERVRKEAEEKAAREAEELRKRLEEAERKAQEEAERLRKEAEERRAREEAERKEREEAERKEREERKKREEAEEEERRKEREERRKREEEEEEARRKEREERRKREEEEERRREEQEAAARKEREERRKREEEEERKREEQEAAARKEREERRKREEEEARKREEQEAAERKEREERRKREAEEARKREEQEAAERKEREERKKREEQEAAERRKREEDERRKREEAEASSVKAKPAEAAPAAGDAAFADSLLADLDNFSQRDEEERKAKEEAERKAKEEAARKAREAEEARKREEEERRRRAEEERRAREEEERRAREEEERQAREEAERQRREEEDRKRRAREALEAAKARERAAATTADDDIGVSDDDLDMDDVRRDEKALSREARQAAREREERREAEPAEGVAAPAAPRKRKNWGRQAAIGAFVVLLVALAGVHLMPVSVGDYEKAASAAFGKPVKIAGGSMSLYSGARVQLDNVRIGEDIRAAKVLAYPGFGGLFAANKTLSRVELEGVTLSESVLGDALFGAFRSDSLKVSRIVGKKVKFEGPVVLPELEFEAVLGEDGAVRTVTLRGPDNLSGRLSPKGTDIEFEVTAGSLALPFAPDATVSNFGMKGSATRQGMRVESWDAAALDGVVKGSANLRWGSEWVAEGQLNVAAMNVAVFAPTLLSEGKVSAQGKFSLKGVEPAKLAAGGRIEGNFNVTKGVIGNFDLSRAIQTGGAQSTGRTLFGEMSGQAVYEAGSVAVRNTTMSAGALNAGISLDIAKDGALSGRIVADVKAATQTLRATLNLGGTLKDPQIRR